MARNASSNLTPLRFRRMSFGGVFLAAFFLFTASFPPPTLADYALFYKTIMMPRQARESDRFAVGQSLALDALNTLDESLAVADAAVVPAKGKFARILGQMLAADVVPRAVDAAFEQAEKTLARIDPGKRAIVVSTSVLRFRMVDDIVALVMSAQMVLVKS